MCSVHRSLHCGFAADLGAADQASESGATAKRRAALSMDVVSGTGGARYPGPTGPDPGRGETFERQHHDNESPIELFKHI